MTDSEMVPHLIPGPLVRSVNPEIVNDARLTAITCIAITSEGVWFEAEPPAEDLLAVRDWLATKDDAGLARRAEYRAIDSTDLLNGFDIARAFALGDPLPEPVYPPPEPEPEPAPG
ncbi:hypothetical protein NOK12_16430 [Nocardioides sp. OK12]|uniref:hypothetical protein n=1 Tax=Nocardioides sp. OK12 TaxID=2758661 RepID=UPI0021C30257|nr:hypothetical protein [Nocardioides sp. OK12]GHJ59125.1 hypothetical protein NOK12_16430 [Nocardioides sp. OK12]